MKDTILHDTQLDGQRAQRRLLRPAADEEQSQIAAARSDTAKRFQQQWQVLLGTHHTNRADHNRGALEPGKTAARSRMKHRRVDAVIASHNLAGRNAATLRQVTIQRFAIDNHPAGNMERHTVEPAISRWNQIEMAS